MSRQGERPLSDGEADERACPPSRRVCPGGGERDGDAERDAQGEERAVHPGEERRAARDARGDEGRDPAPLDAVPRPRDGREDEDHRDRFGVIGAREPDVGHREREADRRHERGDGPHHASRQRVRGEKRDGANDEIGGQHAGLSVDPAADGGESWQHLRALGLNHVAVQVPGLRGVREPVRAPLRGLEGVSGGDVGGGVVRQPHARQGEERGVAPHDEVLRDPRQVGEEPDDRTAEGDGRAPDGPVVRLGPWSEEP